MTAPLEGITVIDFSQFLAGPYASLKLRDMGARIIKVENPDRGDLCRHLYLSDTTINGDSTLFHAINRGKESLTLDLKCPTDLTAARGLIAQADVVIQNFRPGVMERLGLGYQAAKEIKDDIIYGSITGYGDSGEWADLPGQDLLAQARSGLMWLSGNADQGPVPVGLPIADISAGANLAQGLLAALFRHARTGLGAHVETSLLEALIDMQFEFLTTYLNNGQIPPERLSTGSAHGYLPAPYGVYDTADGHLALAMSSLTQLGDLLDLPDLKIYEHNPATAFQNKDLIRHRLQTKLYTRSAANWETELTAQGIWCAKVLDWSQMLQTEIMQSLQMTSPPDSKPAVHTIASPLRMNGNRPAPATRAPALDAQGNAILEEYGLARSTRLRRKA